VKNKDKPLKSTKKNQKILAAGINFFNALGMNQKSKEKANTPFSKNNDCKN
jgi:hypothetical protein